MRILPSVILVLLAVLLPICPVRATSAATPAHHDDLVAFQRDLVNVLALRAQARPLLGAALLARPLPNPPPAIDFHHLLQRALAAPDAGPAITWAELVDCSPQAGNCPNAQALSALQTQDPDNAAVWLMVLGQALHNGDDDAARHALERAATAKTYNDYAGISLQALAVASATLPPPAALYDAHGVANSPAGIRALLVFGLGSMQPLPGLQGAAKLCAVGKQQASILSRCLKLAKVLVWGSSPLSRSLGLHLQETLSADPALRTQAQHSRRDLTWQVQQFGKLTLDSRSQPELAKRLLRMARNGGTEMSLILASLRASGLPVHAPDGWHRKPASAH